ncbi:hypothetical protein ABKV19_000415 [Rosa sericea]
MINRKLRFGFGLRPKPSQPEQCPSLQFPPPFTVFYKANTVGSTAEQGSYSISNSVPHSQPLLHSQRSSETTATRTNLWFLFRRHRLSKLSVTPRSRFLKPRT